MTHAVRLSHSSVPHALSFAAILACLVAAAGIASADEVVIHDRGKKIVLQGKDAADVEEICVQLLRSSRSGEPAVSTDEIRSMRASEVAVEVHYETPQAFELGWTDDRAHAQHLLVPLTGDNTGMDGNSAQIFVGRTAPANEPRYLGIPYYNPPDANGVQYGGSESAPGQLQQLRDKVVQLGIEAPRPTPRPEHTPNVTPMTLEEK